MYFAVIIHYFVLQIVEDVALNIVAFFDHKVGVHIKLPSCNRSDLAGDEGSGGGSINLVVSVLRSDDNTVVTDVVTLVADDEDLGRSNTAEALVAVGITERND